MGAEVLVVASPRAEFRGRVAERLERPGRRVLRTALPGLAAVLERETPFLVVLDAPAGGVEGLARCLAVRGRFDGWLVCLVDEGPEPLRRLALELGADLALPSGDAPELVAVQVEALVGRLRPRVAPPPLRFGDLEVDPSRRDAYLGGRPVGLSTAEFDLLWLLARRAGQVVSRPELYAEVVGGAYNGYDRAIDLHVSHLRRKLGDAPQQPVWLKSVRGVGYQFVGGEPAPLQTVTPS